MVPFSSDTPLPHVLFLHKLSICLQALPAVLNGHLFALVHPLAVFPKKRQGTSDFGFSNLLPSSVGDGVVVGEVAFGFAGIGLVFGSGFIGLSLGSGSEAQSP